MQSLEFSGLTKRYGAVTVLCDVTICLQPGRVHALMGENGAGKSTFIKLLSGVVAADHMQVRRDGRDVALRNPADAARAGFRIIHQELNLVPQLSVAENILLGQRVPHRLGLFVNWRELARRAESALSQLGVTGLDVSAQAGSLTPGDRMLVKIASALVASEGQSPCLYVLDEPTAALSQVESAKLFEVIERLKAEAAVLYVSHRLTEVLTICDDVTVLRNGRRVYCGPIEGTSRDEIILQMTGRALSDIFPARTTPTGAVVAQAVEVTTARLSNVNFALNQGEILGVAGLAGSGQSEVINLLLGLERVIKGSLSLLDRPAPLSPAQAWAQGVAFVPPERRSQGLAMRMGARANALLPHLRGVRARLRAERAQTANLAARVNLKAESLEQSLWQLSGGNQQKVVFARAMAGTPRLLLLDEPTRGVDIGARAEIYQMIRDLSAQSCAVLITSTDLLELLGLCDRIVVLQAGRQVRILDAKGMTPRDLLQACYQVEPAL